jgi:hypothetical protein
MPARWERELLRLREAPVPLKGMRERSQQPPQLGTSLRPARERVIAGAVGLAVFAAVGAFAWGALRMFGDGPTVAEGPPPQPDSPVELWLSADRVPPGPVELVGVLVNHEGVDVIFGVDADVHRWDGNEWRSYGRVVMCMDHWHCTARIERSGGSGAVVPGIGLGPRKGAPGPIERFTTEGLDVGWYRISQTANEGVVARGIFEVADGAPLPASLVNVDAPAISISPALVSPGGDEVNLYPLIPAPSGSQSRDDILRAIDGLSETARIERWDGTAWDVVATVDLFRVPGDSLPRSATVPSLEPGGYRLVRDGPEGPHVGHFWVEETI